MLTEVLWMEIRRSDIPSTSDMSGLFRMSDLTPVNPNILICRMTAETDHVWSFPLKAAVSCVCLCLYHWFLPPPPLHRAHSLPTFDEQIYLYYHNLNGSIMKGLLVIRREGGGPVPTGQRMALKDLLGMLMSTGSWGSALNSSQFLLSFFFFLQALYCGSGCHGSSWFSAVRTAVWGGCVDSDKTDVPEAKDRLTVQWSLFL